MGSRGVGRHAVVTLAGQWTKYLVQIVALVVFSRLLEPSDFGIVAMVAAVAGVAHVIGDFGLSIAALQAERLTDGQRANLFWLSAAIGLLTGLAVMGSGPILVEWYGDARVGPVASALALVFVCNGLAGQFRTELNRAHRFDVLAGTDVLGQVLGLFGGLAVILGGGGLWGLVAQQVIAAAATLLVLATRSGWVPGLPRRGEEMKGLLRFGSLTLAASVVQYLSTNLDQVLIGRASGSVVVGHYNRAFQVARLPAQQLGAPLTRVVLPHLVARRTDRVAFEGGLHRAQATLGAALIGLFGYLIATAPTLVEVALGPGWDAAVPFVRVLCLAGALEAASRVFYWALLARGRPGTLFGAELGARIAMVALMVVAAPIGAIWVAWAAVCGQALLLLTNLLVTGPVARVNPWPLAAIALGAALAVLPGTLLGLWLGERWTGSPAGVELIGVSALWLACAATVLAVPRVRRTAAESVRYVGQVLRRRG